MARVRTAKTSTEVADELFANAYTDVEANESELSVPVAQRKLFTTPMDLSVSSLVDYMKTGQIVIPEFQRHYIWDDGRASRLVESLLIQCPIPVVYLSRTVDERLEVIDGNQRLQSLKRFFADELRLKTLTAFPELNNYICSDVDDRIQRNLKNKTLRCVIIERETHPQIKFDVFQRLNSGAIPLSAQELRHGIYYGPMMRLLDKLTKDPAFSALVGMRREKRMRRQELVLRFFAFRSGYKTYVKPMSAFLNSYAEQHKMVDGQEANELRNVFSSSFKFIKRALGVGAFRPAIGDKRAAFNAAVFDAISVAVGRAPELASAAFNVNKANKLKRAYHKLLRDESFLNSITRATSDERSLKSRIEAVENALGA